MDRLCHAEQVAACGHRACGLQELPAIHGLAHSFFDAAARGRITVPAMITSGKSTSAIICDHPAGNRAGHRPTPIS
jgi:hypothetical protein